MTQQTKLLLLIPHLGGGGAEQVTAQLARHLDPQRFKIHLGLFTGDFEGAKPLPRWVQVHRFHRRRVRHAWLQLIRLVHAEQPDVILSGMAHLNFLILLLRPLLPRATRILVRQNTTASSVAQTWLSRLPYRYLYPRADAILCQSAAMADDLAGHFAIVRDKLKVLANPIDVKTIRADTQAIVRPSADNPSPWPTLLSVGRLAEEKGIDLLLYALPKVMQQHPQVHLTILGAGPCEAKLRHLSATLGLQTATTFAGFRENLPEYYAGASLFVLPSRYEGLPNALLEAAAAGLPLVATPCSAGLCELLHSAPGVWLASDISTESLSRAILTALTALAKHDTKHDRLHDPRRFQHDFLSSFEISTSVAAYSALIGSFAAGARR